MCVRVGARTQVYQFIVALIVVCTILFLQPLFFYLPKAVLSAVIIVAAFGIPPSPPPTHNNTHNISLTR